MKKETKVALGATAGVIAGTGIYLATRPKPAVDIRLENLAIYPNPCFPDEIVTVSVTAVNCGTVIRTRVITCSIAAIDVATKEITLEPQKVTLEPGEDQRLFFSFTSGEVGAYAIEVNGLVSYLAVVEPETLLEEAFGQIIDSMTRLPITGKWVNIDGYLSSAPAEIDGYFYIRLPAGVCHVLKVEGYDDYSLEQEVTVDIINNLGTMFLTPVGITVGILQGYVRDKNTGKLLPLADIHIDDVYNTTTAASGGYRTTELSIGTHTITVTKESYLDGVFEVEVVPGITNVNFELEPVPAIMYCPYCGAGPMQSEAELRDHLVEHLVHGADTIRARCPYGRYTGRFSFDPEDWSYIIAREQALDWILNHIPGSHSLSCYICGADLTWSSRADERDLAWAQHMATVHGIIPPEVEILPTDLGAVYAGAKGALNSEAIRIAGATIYVRGKGQYVWAHGEDPALFELIIPELAGRNWTLHAYGKYCRYNHEFKGDTMAEFATATGSGEYIAQNWAYGAFLMDPDLEFRSDTITLAIEYDNQVLVIGSAFHWGKP